MESWHFCLLHINIHIIQAACCFFVSGSFLHFVFVAPISHISVTSDSKTMLPVLFQRWLLGKSACILATAHLHTARKRLMFGLWREKDSSPENFSSIPTGQTPMSGWLSPRSYRSITGYSCFCAEWVFCFLIPSQYDPCDCGGVVACDAQLQYCVSLPLWRERKCAQLICKWICSGEEWNNFFCCQDNRWLLTMSHNITEQCLCFVQKNKAIKCKNVNVINGMWEMQCCAFHLFASLYRKHCCVLLFSSWRTWISCHGV